MLTDGESPVARRLASLPAAVREAFARVDAVILDVDGVLTDGRIHVASDGTEAMSFYVRDSSGLWFLHHAGVRTGIVTGRATGIPESRADSLRVDAVLSGRLAKEPAVRELLALWNVPPERAAYVGDDVLDAPALRAVGLPVCVADAHEDVLPLARYVTAARGGHGAVREVADLVIEARGDRSRLYGSIVQGNVGSATSP
jgi:3-deoxy-D-manno-octulosonate 8-phosphate phosphatase (KDO 8-P phosphatase)